MLDLGRLSSVGCLDVHSGVHLLFFFSLFVPNYDFGGDHRVTTGKRKANKGGWMP